MLDIGQAWIRLSEDKLTREEGIATLKAMGIKFVKFEADGRTCLISGTYETIRSVEYSMTHPPRNAQ